MSSKYFSDRELSCKCGCGFKIEDPEFLEKLDNLREAFGGPLSLSSAARCWKHNGKIGSKADNHPLGIAVDIVCEDGEKRLDVVTAAINSGFRRIGVATNFIHVDCHPTKKDTIYTYG